MSINKPQKYTKGHFKGKVPLKILLLGEPGVGKTSLRRKYMGENFKANYMMTLGADFSIKMLEDYVMQIWDIAGQDNLAQVRHG